MVRTAEYSVHVGELGRKLADDDLANLYVWLFSEFPPESENLIICLCGVLVPLD